MVPSTSISVTVRPSMRLTLTPGVDIFWVFDQSLGYATRRLVDPQHTLRGAQDGVSVDRLLEDVMAITRDQELGLHVDTEPFTFHTSLPRFQLGDTLLLSVRDEHQVISVELLWYTSTELTQKRFQHQNEEQWAKDCHILPWQTRLKKPRRKDSDRKEYKKNNHISKIEKNKSNGRESNF